MIETTMKSSIATTLPPLITSMSYPDLTTLDIVYRNDTEMKCPNLITLDVGYTDDTGKIWMRWQLSSDADDKDEICINAIVTNEDEVSDEDYCLEIIDDCYKSSDGGEFDLPLCTSKDYNISAYMKCGKTTGERVTAALYGRKIQDIGVPQLSVENYTDSVIRLSLSPPAGSENLVLQYTVSWSRTSEVLVQENTTENVYVANNLDAFTVYSFEARAWTSHGVGPWSNPVIQRTAVGLPDAPENLTVVNFTNTTISLSWNEPLKSNGPIIEYIVSAKGQNKVISKIATETQIILKDLEPFAFYKIFVVAITKAGIGYSTQIFAETDVGVPTTPVKLEVKMTSAEAILTWSQPIITYGPIDGYEVSCHDIAVSEDGFMWSMTNRTSHNFTDLKPWTVYRFSLKAYNVDVKGKKLFSQAIGYKNRTCAAVPLPPNNVYAVKEGSRRVLVEWLYKGVYPGPMNYSIQVWKNDGICTRNAPYIVFNHTEGLSSWTASSVVVANLEPFTHYIFRVEARTEAGSSLSLFSNPVTTDPDTPGRPENFKANCSKHPTIVFLSWNAPNVTNGLIIEFLISYMVTENNQVVRKEKYIPFPRISQCEKKNYSAIITDLHPEQEYNISIKAKTYETDRYGAETFLSDKCILPAGVPPFPENSTTWKAVASVDEVVLTWSKNMFSSVMGRIIFYSVIVALPEKIGEPEQKMLYLTENMPAWSDFWYNGSDSYQATPNNWNPLLSDSYDPMNCQITSRVEGDVLHCTIGFEKNCSSENQLYCNGPLEPGKKYGIKMRAFTKAGFSETYPIFVKTNRLRHVRFFSIGHAVGLTCIIILIVICVVAFLILKWRKKKPFLNLGVHFRKTAEENYGMEFEDKGVEIGISSVGERRPMDFDTFHEHVKFMMLDSALKFSIEYENLNKNSPKLPSTAAELRENRQKNRWMNVYPFDHSRVKLLPIDEEEGSDYINASYIPGFSSPREYIATQGPLSHTMNDFWRMIWEQRVAVIVMLAQCFERGKKKCEQYWPSETGNSKLYGDLKVVTMEESDLPGYKLRLFDVYLDSRNRVIMQIHFTKWPDFGCPDSPEDLVNFVEAVRHHNPLNSTAPILVHCSAGVGRTGTFIAVDRLLHHVQYYVGLDVYSTVLEMRRCRVNMVQTEDQYIYIHKCIQWAIEKLMKYEEDDDSEFLKEIGHLCSDDVSVESQPKHDDKVKVTEM